MPSDTFTNIKASATAAFFARILVHPLDNVRVSIIPSSGVHNGMIPWKLDNLLSIVRREFQYQQKRHEKYNQQCPRGNSTTHNHVRSERVVTMNKGLYRGVSFALIFQVPALAIFLSTYDATKNGLAQLANFYNLQSFQLCHSETHLVSGMIAKVAGTAIWAPMQRIQSMATHPVLGQVPLTLKEACSIGKNICRLEGAAGLWSGYTKFLSTLLPYTMIYFATYEQFKQIARWIVSHNSTTNEIGSFQYGAAGDNLRDRWTALREYWSISELQSQKISSTKLSLDTYMMCIASAVVVSSALCQTASSIRAIAWGYIESSQQPIKLSDHNPLSKNRIPLIRLVKVFSKQISPASSISPLSLTKRLLTSLSVIATTRANGFKYPSFVSLQFKTLTSGSSAVTTQSQPIPGLPWKQRQRATLTTTGILPFRSSMAHQHIKNPVYSTTSPNQIVRSNNIVSMMSHSATALSLNNNNEMKHATTSTRTKSTQTSGLVRSIFRSLGPRILWTVPGVTLTTAGFEFLRDI
ncbi:hypothetical protein BGZ46_000961 [Entomortierella lignicola]|nr:hypothetical protein BGZ46_000961 [Entomortierella lignicola]